MTIPPPVVFDCENFPHEVGTRLAGGGLWNQGSTSVLCSSLSLCTTPKTLSALLSA